MSKMGQAGVISPMHAVLRCLAQFGGLAMDQDGIIEKFTEVQNERIWTKGGINEALGLAVKEGYAEYFDDVGWKITEAGRGEIGPLLENDLRYV